MKPKLLVLLGALSLAANVAFVVHDLRSDARGSKPSAQTPQAAEFAPRLPAVDPLASMDGDAWVKMQPVELSGLVARLRAAGCPPTVVRALLEALALKHRNARQRELIPALDPKEFWKSPVYRPDARAQAELRELDRAHRKLIKNLLGPDYYDADKDGVAADPRRQFGDLPPEKVGKLRKILSDYDDILEQIYAENPSRVSAANRAKVALLEKEKRGDLEHELTSAELADYDLRNSDSAQGLRNGFGKFVPTEAEFRALYPAQKAKDDALPRMTRPITPEMQRLREAAEQALDAQFRSVLGEVRYAEFKRANDSYYQQVSSFVASSNLPPSATETLIAIQQDTTRRADAVRGNRALTAEQRAGQLAALADEATTKLAGVIGATGLTAYQRRGGYWLYALKREMPPESDDPPE